MEFNVKIVRSKRKSLSLTVAPDNEITLRCPLRTSDSRINSFIESKKTWLSKVVALNEVKISSNRAVFDYKEIYVGGEKLPLIFSDRNEITDNAVIVKNVKSIKKLYISHFSEKFLNFAKTLSANSGLYAGGFSVKAYKSRWGCCDSIGKITFNYLLFMLPLKVQKYVIIHELCHTVHFNHSTEFWRLVSKLEPDYKNLRVQLKNYDFITNLY